MAITPLGHLEDRIWEPRPGAPGGRRNRRGFAYQVFVPDFIADREFELRGDVTAAVADATAALEGLNASPPRLASLEALARQLLRSESLASSRIEGLELSQRRLARAAFAGDGSQDQRAADVLGNVRAMEKAIALGLEARALSPVDIDEVHRTLLRFGLDRSIAGVVRTTQNWIGTNPWTPLNADYTPPPPELVPALLADLCEFADGDHLPAVVQAAIAHAQFETIHPFADGNGRVGRALIHTILRRRGVASRWVPPISVILAARKRDYIAGLNRYRDGGLGDWVELFSIVTEEAAREAGRLADEVGALQARWLEQLGQPRSDAAVRQVVAALPEYPVIDVRTAERVTGKSNPASGAALNRLEDAGILKRIGERNWRRTWECRELFDLVEGIERELLAPPR